MLIKDHVFETFHKGRIKIKACTRCGELRLPSNVNENCVRRKLSLSPIGKAGYVLSVKDENSAEQAA